LICCVKTAEVLGLKLMLPLKTAVIDCEPTDSVDVVKVALPLLKRGSSKRGCSVIKDDGAGDFRAAGVFPGGL
jgi:hypothetical protein